MHAKSFNGVYQGIISMPDSRISVISDVVKTLIQETILNHNQGQLVDPEDLLEAINNYYAERLVKIMICKPCMHLPDS